MKRWTMKLSVLVSLLTLMGSASAQNSTGPAPTQDAAVLSNLPRVALQPDSLFDASQAIPPSKPSLPLKPYAVLDPLLDPDTKEPPGWFSEVWSDVLHPRLVNHLRGVLPLPEGGNMVISTGTVPLDWTVMPALAVGYRMPSGLGECSFLVRGFSTSGSSTEGPAALHSRLNLYVAELNYANDEFFPYPNWKFKPQIGLRYAWTYFDVTMTAPGDSIAGFTDRKNTNLSFGIGPHAGLEIGRQIVQVPGLSLIGQMDLCGTVGWGKQQALQFSSLSQGGPSGEDNESASSYFQVLTLQAGIGYQPPGMPEVQFFAGYTHESWWSVGIMRLSGASFSLDGLALRATLQY